jgi:streptogramin lyase
VTPNGTLWFGVGHGPSDAALLSYKNNEVPVFPPVMGFSGVVNHLAAGPDGSLYVAAGNSLYFIK